MKMAVAGLGVLFALALFTPAVSADDDGLETAIFAGGCFWCVESDFDGVPGVVKTVSGFTGGTVANPSYRQVVGGATGHRESVQVFYDPKKVTYEALLDVFWHSVDPTDAGGQFCDRGMSYTTAVFATSAMQKTLAEKSKRALDASDTLPAPVVTAVETAGPFYAAEDYHQDYYLKNPVRYKFYRFRCGRDDRLRSLWGADALRGLAKH